jgi:hypothetical protein
VTTEPNKLRHRATLTSLIGGSALVVVGGAMLADQLGYALAYRWVFLVLLLPAAAAIADGVRLSGQLGWRAVPVLSRLIAGALFAAIGTMLVLKLDTGIILPGLAIALGAITIIRTVFGRA